jgi:GH15 family glucan-1,4-alpha-glucosidase
MTARELRAHSIELILDLQDTAGAWVACPSFPTYRYAWLRDDSFIAYAMLLCGELESCRRFLEWGSAAIERHAPIIAALERRIGDGSPVRSEDVLPTRFTLDGRMVNDDWPNFQIDGYGTWLWCLTQYVRRTGDDAALRRLRGSAELAVRYLSLTWRMPTYDCWEEHHDGVHPSTLACVYGGLKAISAALGLEAAGVAAEVRGHVLSNLTREGTFPKTIGTSGVDASLLWLSVPFGLVEPQDPRICRTVQRIEQCLCEKGGVKRYEEDTYYGGGQWLLLTAWLGWYRARVGDSSSAATCLQWVVDRADPSGNLPEQSLAITNDPLYIDPWRARWGEVASPLLWSHAMYLVLWDALDHGGGGFAREKEWTCGQPRS